MVLDERCAEHLPSLCNALDSWILGTAKTGQNSNNKQLLEGLVRTSMVGGRDAQQLSVLAAYRWVPKTHIVARNYPKPSRGPDTLFWPWHAQVILGTHTHTGKAFIHRK